MRPRELLRCGSFVDVRRLDARWRDADLRKQSEAARTCARQDQ
jgi:hypothetical protein